MPLDPKIAKSRRQETRGAQLHSGTKNSGSGNTPWRKNDVRAHDGRTLIEYKRTDKKSITIKLQDLEDNRTNALLEGRDALFGIEIGGRDYVIVEASDYERQQQLLSTLTSDHQPPGSTGAGTRLDGSQVLPTGGRSVLPETGAREQGVAKRSQGRLQGTRRLPAVPPHGGLS